MQKRLKVAIFYPWNNIMERKSGSSRRSGEMLDVLKDEFTEIIFTSVLKLVKIENPKTIKIIVSADWKYSLYKFSLAF